MDDLAKERKEITSQVLPAVTHDFLFHSTHRHLLSFLILFFGACEREWNGRQLSTVYTFTPEHYSFFLLWVLGEHSYRPGTFKETTLWPVRMKVKV